MKDAEASELEPVDVFVGFVDARDLGCYFEFVVAAPKVAALLQSLLRLGLGVCL